jgi:carbon monoxide dehydrogenase subunit G
MRFNILISISEEIAGPAPPGRVWEVVSNPAEVVSCIGGAELGEAHDDGSFDGSLAVKFGAVRIRFAARVSLELAESEFEGTLSARGRDGQGATRFNAHAVFRVVRGDGPGDSRVAVDGEINLTGKLVSLIEAGAGVMVSKMTRDFAAELVRLCVGSEEAAAGVVGAVGETAVSTAAVRSVGLLSRLRVWWSRLLRKGVRAQ